MHLRQRGIQAPGAGTLAGVGEAGLEPLKPGLRGQAIDSEAITAAVAAEPEPLLPVGRNR